MIRAQRRTLSSGPTRFLRTGLPLVWLAFAAAAAWMTRSVPALLPGLLVAAVVPPLLLRMILGRLREVSTDGRLLFVSDGRREVALPFTAIDAVEERPGSRRRAPAVVLRVNTPTPFGQEIAFAPRMRWLPDAGALQAAQRLHAEDPGEAARVLWASLSPAEEIRRLMEAHAGPERSPS